MVCCDTGEAVCTHRSGVRIRPLDSRLFKKWPDLRSGRRSIFLRRVLLLYRHVSFFPFFFVCFDIKTCTQFQLMYVCGVKCQEEWGEYLIR